MDSRGQDRTGGLPGGKPEQDIAPGVTPTGRDDTYVARVARGAGISTLGQGVGRLLGFITQIAISRLFGAETYGFYSSGVAVVTGAQTVSRFGMENSVVRYVAHHRAKGDTPRVKGTIVQTVLITLGISLALGAALFFTAPFVATHLPNSSPEMATVIRAFAFVLPFFVFMSMVAWATQGFQTVTYAAYVQQFARPALFLVLLGAFYLFGRSVTSVIAAYGAAMLLAGLLGVYFLKRLFPPLFDRRVPPKMETRELFKVSIPLSIATGARYLDNQSAVLILTAFAAGAPVGIFNAAARTATLSTIVRFAFSGIFSPIISSFYARGELDQLGRLYKDVSRWIFIGAFPIFLVIVVLGHDILAVFGKDFVRGESALWIVAVAQLFSASVGTTPRMLAMTGRQNIEMVATTSAAILGVIVSLLLVPHFGIIGAAVGMATAIVAENAGTMGAVRWKIGFWPYSPEWLKPLIAGVVAALATYFLGLFFPVHIPIVRVAALGVFLGMVFLAVLLLLGLSETDREFLRTFWNVARRYLPRRLGRG